MHGLCCNKGIHKTRGGRFRPKMRRFDRSIDPEVVPRRPYLPRLAGDAHARNSLAVGYRRAVTNLPEVNRNARKRRAKDDARPIPWFRHKGHQMRLEHGVVFSNELINLETIYFTTDRYEIPVDDCDSWIKIR